MDALEIIITLLTIAGALIGATAKALSAARKGNEEDKFTRTGHSLSDRSERMRGGDRESQTSDKGRRDPTPRDSIGLAAAQHQTRKQRGRRGRDRPKSGSDGSDDSGD